MPIVPALFAVIAQFFLGIGTDVIGSSWSFFPFVSTLSVVASLLIWAPTIRWTWARIIYTLLISFLPFVQVVYRDTWWSSKDWFLRFDVMFLAEGQYLVSLGLWIGLMSCIWWSKNKENTIVEKREKQSQGIPANVLRSWGLALSTLPLLVGLFLVAAAADSTFFKFNNSVLVFAPLALVAVFIWILIWKRYVQWSKRVIKSTFLLAMLCYAIPFGLVWGFNTSNDLLVGLPFLGWGVWMAATIRFWPLNLPASSLAELTPRCRKCSYLLTGLTSTRCPECGDQPTLDELWRSLAGC